MRRSSGSSGTRGAPNASSLAAAPAALALANLLNAPLGEGVAVGHEPDGAGSAAPEEQRVGRLVDGAELADEDGAPFRVGAPHVVGEGEQSDVAVARQHFAHPGVKPALAAVRHALFEDEPAAVGRHPFLVGEYFAQYLVALRDAGDEGADELGPVAQAEAPLRDGEGARVVVLFREGPRLGLGQVLLDFVEARLERFAADAGELVYRPAVSPALVEVGDHRAGRPSSSPGA